MNIEHRPWGSYQILLRETGFQVKRIELKPGLRFSLQRHLRREEKWVIISGSGLVTLDSKELPIQKGSFVEVPIGQIHRMKNTGSGPLVFIEVQLGDYLGEDDITRFEDDFGRS